MIEWLRLACNVFAIWAAMMSSRLLPTEHARTAEIVLMIIVVLSLHILFSRWLGTKQRSFAELLNRYAHAAEDRTRAEPWSVCHSGPFPAAAQDDAERSRRYLEACLIARELHSRVLEDQ